MVSFIFLIFVNSSHNKKLSETDLEENRIFCYKCIPMEINRIKYFRVVYETKSIRRAAELLYMTPGALSKSIKVLESEIGNPLFVLKGRNLLPSDFAKKFYRLSENLVMAYNDLDKEIKKEEVKRPFTIVSWEIFTSYFCARFSASLKDMFSLKILERGPGDVEKEILENNDSIGITYIPVIHEDLDFFKVGEIEYFSYALKDHFFESRGKGDTFCCSHNAISKLAFWCKNFR